MCGAYQPDRSDFPDAVLQNGNEAFAPDVFRANELGEDRDSEPGQGSRVRECEAVETQPARYRQQSVPVAHLERPPHGRSLGDHEDALMGREVLGSLWNAPPAR